MNRLGAALKGAFGRGYGVRDLRADLLAGCVVGIVALPLSMALAIASGVPPQHGLYTAIVAGFVVAMLGGSSVQVSGPTAAFVVILAPIAGRFGLGGLLLAGAMAGALLIIMGFAGFGQLVQFVPAPVTTGFTAGIAVVIATLQIRDLLGLQIAALPDTYVDKLAVLTRALPSISWPDVAIGALSLAILILWPRWNRTIPAPLVALAVGACVAAAIPALFSGVEAATIRSRFATPDADGSLVPGIPRLPPLPHFPWTLPDASGKPVGLSFELLRALLPSAFAIAMLGAIESLLSAVVADGMTGERHDPDSELIAQGAGNLVAPFFGGIAATGAIARTATNVRAGGRSPIAAATHSLVVLAAVLLLAPALGFLPMAALAALLLLVAWNMGEAKHFAHLLRVAPRSDGIVLLTCFALTVFFDMTISVTVGVVLAALLLLRRLAQTSGGGVVPAARAHEYGELPSGVVLYEIRGPLVFGAAQKAMMALRVVDRRGVKVIVLDLEDTSVLDATGLLQLEEIVDELAKHGIQLVLMGVQAQPLRVFAKANWRKYRKHVRIYRSTEQGLAAARRLAQPLQATKPAHPTQ
jgi:SulP family sulfate permease